jgi:hypothetical protein
MLRGKSYLKLSELFLRNDSLSGKGLIPEDLSKFFSLFTPNESAVFKTWLGTLRKRFDNCRLKVSRAISYLRTSTTARLCSLPTKIHTSARADGESEDSAVLVRASSEINNILRVGNLAIGEDKDPLLSHLRLQRSLNTRFRSLFPCEKVANSLEEAPFSLLFLNLLLFRRDLSCDL